MQPFAVLEVLILLLVANGAPIIIKRVLGQTWNWPIDSGLRLGDGEPLFGKSKTYRGILGSILVTSLAAYSDYQEKRAWVWEHQALTRARHCAGSARIGRAFEEEREHILTLERDHAALFAEVRAMRRKMHDGHPNRSALFDLKHDSGGMVDIEFCVQALVLAHARAHRQLIGNLGNIALLGLAGEAGLITPEVARGAADAYRAYRKRQHVERLNNSEFARVPPGEFSERIAIVKRLWSEVLGPPA